MPKSFDRKSEACCATGSSAPPSAHPGQAVDRLRRRRAHDPLLAAAGRDPPHRHVPAPARTSGATTASRCWPTTRSSISLCYLGVMSYGATICTVHVEMNRNQLDNILTRLEPKLVLYQDDLGLDDLLSTVAAPSLPLGSVRPAGRRQFFAEVVAQCEPSEAQTAAGPDDDAVILFTSGTSAQPKGVVLNFREHLGNIDPTADGFGIGGRRPGVRFPLLQLGVGAAPRRPGAGQPRRHPGDGGEILGQPLLPARPRSPRDGRGRQPDHHQHPAQHRRRLRIAPICRRLRFITSSSAPLTVEEWRRFEERFGIPIAQGYGSSETGWIAAIPGEQRRLGTVGRPLAYHDLADRRCRRPPAAARRDRPGRDRRLCRPRLPLPRRRRHACRSTAAAASAPAISGCSTPTAFSRLTGREKDLIIRGGVNISPVEIDSFLMQRPELIEVATVGVPDAIYGEEVVSYVVARPGVDDRCRGAAALSAATGCRPSRRRSRSW